MTSARSSRAMIFQRGTRTIAGHIMTVVFIGMVVNGEHCISRLGLLDDIERKTLAFDHQHVLSDYKQWITSGGSY